MSQGRKHLLDCPLCLYKHNYAVNTAKKVGGVMPHKPRKLARSILLFRIELIATAVMMFNARQRV